MLKEEFNELSFEELHELQEKVGVKQYNKAVLRSAADTHQDDGKDGVKRKSSRPEEISSKIRNKKPRNTFAVKKKVKRDPRFDDLSGNLDEEKFEKSYEFLSEMRQKELKEVEKHVKREKNPDRKYELLQLKKRLDSQQKARQRLKEVKEEKRLRKKTELESVKEGKKPFYLKKSEVKKLELRQKFEKLKETGQLEKYMSKRRKRNASKQKKLLPSLRDKS